MADFCAGSRDAGDGRRPLRRRGETVGLVCGKDYEIAGGPWDRNFDQVVPSHCIVESLSSGPAFGDWEVGGRRPLNQALRLMGTDRQNKGEILDDHGH